MLLHFIFLVLYTSIFNHSLDDYLLGLLYLGTSIKSCHYLSWLALRFN